MVHLLQETKVSEKRVKQRCATTPGHVCLFCKLHTQMDDQERQVATTYQSNLGGTQDPVPRDPSAPPPLEPNVAFQVGSAAPLHARWENGVP